MRIATQVIAALAVLGASVAPARADMFEKGIKAGVNIANSSIDIDGGTPPDLESVTGLTAGVFVSVGFGPIAIEPDILFTAKGYKYDTTVGAAALSVVNNFNYIEVPILLKWMIIPAGPVRPYLGAGPSIAFLMSAESKADLAGAETTQDVKDSLSSSDYSAVLDAGISFSLGIAKVSADVRYSIGLADVDKTTGVNTKNSVISILAGVAF